MICTYLCLALNTTINADLLGSKDFTYFRFGIDLTTFPFVFLRAVV